MAGTAISGDPSDTTFNVKDAMGLPPVPFIVAFGSELIRVVSVNEIANTITVDRAAYSSDLESHAIPTVARTSLDTNRELILSVGDNFRTTLAIKLNLSWGSQLTANVSIEDTTIPVQSFEGFEGGLVQVGSEFMDAWIDPENSTVLSVSRGLFGSTVAAHETDDVVTYGHRPSKIDSPC